MEFCLEKLDRKRGRMGSILWKVSKGQSRLAFTENKTHPYANWNDAV